VTGPQHETEALENVPANLYSDLLIHDMGSDLADNITQGLAQGDMFRTTPLWGIGQRLFFLHDGRTSDLLAAIKAHSSEDGRGDGSYTSPLTQRLCIKTASFRATTTARFFAFLPPRAIKAWPQRRRSESVPKCPSV
jgi:hypothetical protein